MVYREKFVAVIKVNGKILREFNELVELPFGTEYSILLKNLNNQRAVVDITIDGEDVLDGNQLVVNANSTTELDGFMRGNKTTHKFKFIEKTQEISDFRGDDIEDGIVRIEYRFEESLATWISKTYPSDNVWRSMPIGNGGIQKSSGDPMQVMYASSCNVGSSLDSVNCSLQNLSCDVSCDNDEGITVKGSESNQQFNEVHMWNMEDESHVICLKLKGRSGKKVYKRAVTVKTKKQCDTCGRRWKSSKRFCGNCGTALFN